MEIWNYRFCEYDRHIHFAAPDLRIAGLVVFGLGHGLHSADGMNGAPNIPAPCVEGISEFFDRIGVKESDLRVFLRENRQAIEQSVRSLRNAPITIYAAAVHNRIDGAFRPDDEARMAKHRFANSADFARLNRCGEAFIDYIEQL